jgi:hypothetical protein
VRVPSQRLNCWRSLRSTSRRLSPTLSRAADRETAAQSLAAARKLWPRAVVVNEVLIEPIGVTMLGDKKP